jgi:hypothetical protein
VQADDESDRWLRLEETVKLGRVTRHAWPRDDTERHAGIAEQRGGVTADRIKALGNQRSNVLQRWIQHFDEPLGNGPSL